MWSVERKQPLASLTGHDGPVVALTFSPDGRFLVSGEERASTRVAENATGVRRPIRLWSVPEEREILAFGAPDADVRDVAFSPDSKTLAVSDLAGVTLWDARTGEIRETFRWLSTPSAPMQRLGADEPLSRPIAFSPDGRSLAAGGDSALVFWTAAPFGSAAVEKTVAAP